MNLTSYLVLAVIAVLFVLALRYSLTHKSCSSCALHGSCTKQKNACSLYERYHQDHPRSRQS